MRIRKIKICSVTTFEVLLVITGGILDVGFVFASNFMHGIYITLVHVIVSGEPYLIAAEDGILHCGHFVGCEEKLCTVVIDSLIFKHKESHDGDAKDGAWHPTHR